MDITPERAAEFRANIRTGPKMPHMPTRCHIFGRVPNHTRPTFYGEIAARIAVALDGRPAGDLIVLHACDNPECVRPDHLRLGTYAENTRDMLDRGRSRARDVMGQWHAKHTPVFSTKGGPRKNAGGKREGAGRKPGQDPRLSAAEVAALLDALCPGVESPADRARVLGTRPERIREALRDGCTERRAGQWRRVVVGSASRPPH